MKRSTRNLLRAAAFTPAAALIAFSGAPSYAAIPSHGHAAPHGLLRPYAAKNPAVIRPYGGTGGPGAPAGPLAAFTGGALQTAAGQAAPGAADLAHPAAALPPAGSAADGIVTLAGGHAAVKQARDGAQQALTTLGGGTAVTRNPQAAALPVAGRLTGAASGVTFSGLSARCVTEPAGEVRSAATVTGGRLVDGATGRIRTLPAAPAPNLQVPTGDPDLLLTLNKQVSDASGTTVLAVSLDQITPTGEHVTRDLAIAHCAPAVGRVPAAVGADRAVATAGLPDPAAAGGLRAPLAGLSNVTPASAKDALPAGVGDMQFGEVFGGLPGLPTQP